MARSMMRAKVFGDRVHCGRLGCSGGPFGTLGVMGRNGGGDVWIIELASRWVWRFDLRPQRWLWAARPPRSYANHGDREGAERLPTCLECPSCGALQEVVPPG